MIKPKTLTAVTHKSLKGLLKSDIAPVGAISIARHFEGKAKERRNHISSINYNNYSTNNTGSSNNICIYRIRFAKNSK